MNNALFEYKESKYVEFKVSETTLKDEFLEIAIRKTYSRYGHEQNASKRSWRNLQSGIKVLHGFDIKVLILDTKRCEIFNDLNYNNFSRYTFLLVRFIPVNIYHRFWLF